MEDTSKAVYFDWNGTLLADALLTMRSTNHILAKYAKKTVSVAEYREKFTVPLSRMYQAFGFDAQELTTHNADIQHCWNDVYNRAARGARLRRGARRLLQELNEDNVTLHVLSNHTIENISGHMARLGIGQHFSAILANDDASTCMHYGKGERLRRHVATHNIRDAFIVGDSEEEIDIARANGFFSIAITNGYCSTRRLKAAKPDFLVRSLLEIPAIVRRLFGAKRKVA